MSQNLTTILIEMVGNVAPPGWVWRCRACGKKVSDRNSEAGGWDELCMLNSRLVKE